MDYKKKYEEANDKVAARFGTNVAKEIFTDLYESEDERIRKEIISFLQLPHPQFVGERKQEKWLAYIEKQGEQKHVDKIKSKFKVGDWIVSPGGCYLHILDIEEDGYLCEDIFGEETKVLCEHPDCDFKLWTIEDAKDGDVLASHECLVLFKEIDGLNIRCHCTYHFMNNPSFYVDTLQNKDAFHPATKEQRELLFQKIKEEGYEWDADEKALVMIGIDNDEEDERYEKLMEDDETNIKQNPAWSEEDETGYNDSLWAIKQVRTVAKNENDMGNLWYAEKWLKSIKDRVQLQNWKPSDKQMHAFEQVYDWYNNNFAASETLTSLYQDLKKLKG